MSYLQDITARFPVRKRDEEKEAFRKWAVAQGKTLGYSARVGGSWRADGTAMWCLAAPSMRR